MREWKKKGKNKKGNKNRDNRTPWMAALSSLKNVGGKSKSG